MIQDYFTVSLQVTNRWGSGDVYLGIPLDHMAGVERLTLATICPIPGVPAAVRGVVQQRGSLIWVVDLGRFLQLPGIAPVPTTTQPAFTLVLPEGERRRLTCLVSQLHGIISVDSTSVQPVPAHLQRRQRSLLEGIIDHNSERVAILNPTALLKRMAVEAQPVHP